MFVEPVWKILGKEYRELSDVLDKALEVKISERTQTMRAFLDGIKYCREQIEGSRVPPKPPVIPVRPPRNKSRQQFYPYLDGLRGPISGLRYPLPVNKIVTIGRLESNDIVIPSRVVGRRHLEIFFDTMNGWFYLVDNDSVNGTYVDKRRCRPSVIIPVRAGSIISLAQNACVFQLGVADEQF